MTWLQDTSRSRRGIIALFALVSVLAACRLALDVTFGLRADYFVGARSLSDTPSFSAVDDRISTAALVQNWLGDVPATFRVRWYGYLAISEPADYGFGLLSDDGSTLTIDGQRVIDNGGVHGAALQVNAVHLDAGSHAVLIEYTQAGGDYAVEWLWSKPAGAPLSPVPASVLSVRRTAPGKLWFARIVNWALLVAVVALLGAVLYAAGWTGARRAREIVTLFPRAATLALFVLLAAGETWPLAAHPSRLSRNDNRDTVLNEWVMSWVSHQAVRSPLRLYDANIFYPERDTLARSESLIVQSAVAAPVLWLGGSPVLAYNLVLLAGFALTGWTMCLVLARWTASWTAAITGGIVFAFNAHTFTRMPHIQAQHVEFLPLALYALDGLLRHPDLKQAARLACWATLQALTSIYLLVMTAAALAAAVAARPEDWWNRRALRVAGMLLLAAALAGLVLVPYLLPYRYLESVEGLSRTLQDATAMSASWNNYISTPARVHYGWWSYRWFGDDAMFPGVIALALAAVAVGRGVAWRDRRARMCLALGLAGVYLSFGTYAPGYAALYAVVPLLRAVRGVSRFGYLVMPAVAVLAAFGIRELQVLARSRRAAPLLALVPVLVALEVLPAPVEYTRFEGIAPIYARLRGEPGVVVAEMPFFGMGAEFLHANYMLNSTAHWQPMINGYSGFQTAGFRRYADVLEAFPDARSIAALEQGGVTHVFVHTALYSPNAIAVLDAWPGVARVAEDEGIVLYRLPRPSGG